MDDDDISRIEELINDVGLAHQEGAMAGAFYQGASEQAGAEIGLKLTETYIYACLKDPDDPDDQD